MDTHSPRKTGPARDEVGSKAWVAFAKGVAILLVVLYHTVIYFEAEGVWGSRVGSRCC